MEVYTIVAPACKTKLYLYEDYSIELEIYELNDWLSANAEKLIELLENNSFDVFTDKLECVEAMQCDNGGISSEKELSDRFDNLLSEIFPDFNVDDEPALSEFFNNWVDSLCRDGELHQLQYSKYCYVGKYS